jgi:Family of unknown function (DUF6191)
MVVWVVTMPALVVALTLLAILDQVLLWLGKARVLPWRRGRSERRVSATGFEVLHGHLAPGKAQELKQRATSLVLRDEQDEGAPPRSRVDLDTGLAVIRIEPRDAAPREGRQQDEPPAG